MKHDDMKDLENIEKEIKHLNRLNGINHKILRQNKELARQRTRVSILSKDGVRGRAYDLNF